MTYTLILRARRTQVSWECRDLLTQMLTADPEKRIRVAGIMQHPWFLQDLPVGTLDVNGQLQRTDTARCPPLPPPLRPLS